MSWLNQALQIVGATVGGMVGGPMGAKIGQEAGGKTAGVLEDGELDAGSLLGSSFAKKKKQNTTSPYDIYRSKYFDQGRAY